MKLCSRFFFTLFLFFQFISFAEALEKKKEVVYYPGGTVKQTFFYYEKEGEKVLHGRFKEFYTANILLKSIDFKDGLPHGKYKEFYREGGIRCSGLYKKGVKRGKWCYYNSHGVLKLKACFDKQGNKEWVLKFDEYGKKTAKEYYNQGKLYRIVKWGPGGSKLEKIVSN